MMDDETLFECPNLCVYIRGDVNWHFSNSLPLPKRNDISRPFKLLNVFFRKTNVSETQNIRTSVKLDKSKPKTNMSSCPQRQEICYVMDCLPASLTKPSSRSFNSLLNISFDLVGYSIRWDIQLHDINVLFIFVRHAVIKRKAKDDNNIWEHFSWELYLINQRGISALELGNNTQVGTVFYFALCIIYCKAFPGLPTQST